MKKSKLLEILLLIFSLFFSQGSFSKDIKIVTFDYPPYIESKKLRRGWVAEVVYEAFDRMGQNLKVEFHPLARDFALVESGSVDGMFAAKKNEERQRKYIYSTQPLLRQEIVFFSRSKSNFKFDGTIKSISNLSIGVLNGAIYGFNFDNAIKKNEIKNIEISFNDEMSFKKLINGRMDILICGREVGLEVSKRLGILSNIKIIGPAIDVADSFLILSRNESNAYIVKKFDEKIKSMRQDGTVERIRKKYSVREYLT